MRPNQHKGDASHLPAVMRLMELRRTSHHAVISQDRKAACFDSHPAYPREQKLIFREHPSRTTKFWRGVKHPIHCMSVKEERLCQREKR